MNMNRRGQDFLRSNFLGWAIGILTLIVIVFLILWFAGYLGSVPEGVPDVSEIIIQGCSVAAQGNLIGSYCYQFRELGSDKYYTCGSEYMEGILTEYDVDVGAVDCMDKTLTTRTKEFCEAITESRQNKVEVNGVTCATYLSKTCRDLGGSWISNPNTNSCDPPSKDITSEVTDNSDKPKADKPGLCCKEP